MKKYILLLVSLLFISCTTSPKQEIVKDYQGYTYQKISNEIVLPDGTSKPETWVRINPSDTNRVYIPSLEYQLNTNSFVRFYPISK